MDGCRLGPTTSIISEYNFSCSSGYSKRIFKIPAMKADTEWIPSPTNCIKDPTRASSRIEVNIVYETVIDIKILIYFTN